MVVVYFQYPVMCGPVYATHTDGMALNRQIVQLPGGKHIRVTLEKDSLIPVVGELGAFSGAETSLKAHVVIGEDSFEKVFTGDWESLAALINAAAEVNTTFTVILPVAEYEKLQGGGIERTRLLDLLSERAKSLIQLFNAEEVWHNTGGLPALELLRTGQCR